MKNLILGAILFSITIVLIQWVLYLLLGSVLLQIFLQLAGLYYLGRQVCLYITIPGQNALYRQLDQIYLNDQLVRETLQEVKGIKQTTLKNLDVYKTFVKRLIYLKKQHCIFSRIPSKNRLQQQYFNLLSKLFFLVENTNLNIDEQEEITQENTNLSIDEQKQIKEQSDAIDRFLNVNQNYQYSTIRKLFSQRLFAPEYRKIQISNNQNVERVQILNQETQSNLDCLLIKTQEYSNQAIFFCNPNGVTYEEQYFDDDWYKFYKQIGLNVITWNYCGYGESTGKPTLQNYINDGIFVVWYFQHRKKQKILGAHGTSLGGMIASEIATAISLQFLIVDRSFSSIGQIASVRFGKLARRIYNFLCNWDSPNFMKFYSFAGPKLIIQNANDKIIPYAAQMQTSMVRCYFSKIKDIYFKQESQIYLNFFYKTICKEQKVKKFCQQLNQIFSLEKNIDKDYQGKFDENEVKNFKKSIHDLKIILQTLNYNGNDFLYVMESNANEEKVALFFGSCFTYGQQGVNKFDESFNRFQDKLNSFQSRELEIFGQASNQANFNLKNIVKYLSKTIFGIVAKFREYLKNIDPPEMPGHTYQQSNSTGFILGELVTVKSEHNSQLTQDEKKKCIRKHNFQ